MATWKPAINSKQEQVLKMCREKRYVLLSGPRRSGKTISAIHAVAQHAFTVKNAQIAVVAHTQSVGLRGGIWDILTKQILPQWIDAGIGMEWVKKPKVMRVAQTPMCSVSNIFGQEVEIHLQSLKFEQEVEDRFKGADWSMIFVNELSKFHERHTFDTWILCFRGMGRDPKDFLFLADTNPPEGDGTAWWAYKLWFEEAIGDYTSSTKKNFYDKFGLLKFSVADNTFEPPEELEILRQSLEHDPDKLARYWFGEYTTKPQDAIFADLFLPNIHVIGQVESLANPNPDILEPSPDCTELFCGWDMGTTKNSAFVIFEKVMKEYLGGIVLPSFFVLDEVTCVGVEINIFDFLKDCLEKMHFWQKRTGRILKWQHFSDRSVFDLRSLDSGRFQSQIIYEASDYPENECGAITFQAAGRGANTIQPKIDLLRKLLYENRIFFSANFTPMTLEMLRKIRKPKTNLPMDRHSRYKHCWDALMYPVAEECHSEMNAAIVQRYRKQREENEESSIISLP